MGTAMEEKAEVFRRIQEYNHKAHQTRAKLEEKAMEALAEGDYSGFRELLRQIDDVKYMPYTSKEKKGPELPAWIVGASAIERRKK